MKKVGGLIITGIFHKELLFQRVLCDNNKDNNKDNNNSSYWYPTKYLQIYYNNYFLTEDDLHFKKYLSNNNNNNSNNYNGLMSWPSMINGIKKRENDDKKVQEILEEFKNIQLNTNNNNNNDNNSNNEEKQKELLELYTKKIEDIVYGNGLTAKDKHEHFIKYGCATYTDQALRTIVDHVPKSKYTGIIEIGAGYGQWAKVLHDKYGIDIIAVDSMISLPVILSKSNENENDTNSILHYMYKSVQKGTEKILDRQVQDYTHPELNISKRALMIIYPDPNSQMAYNSLKKYSTNDTLIWNDLFIYVGEGRNGVNASKEFFDTLEGLNEEGKLYKWKLVYTCKLNPFGGHNNKGFERLFIFKRDLQKPNIKYVSTNNNSNSNNNNPSFNNQLNIKIDDRK